MPNTFFSCQTTLNKVNFLEFGLKNANLATLTVTLKRAQHVTHIYTSVEHDPVSESRSNRILQLGTGSEWISKKTTGSDTDIQTALIIAVKCLIRVFLGYKPDWIKYLDRSTRLGSDRITQ